MSIEICKRCHGRFSTKENEPLHEWADACNCGIGMLDYRVTLLESRQKDSPAAPQPEAVSRKKEDESSGDFWKRMAERAMCGCLYADCTTHGGYDPNDIARIGREQSSKSPRVHDFSRVRCDRCGNYIPSPSIADLARQAYEENKPSAQDGETKKEEKIKVLFCKRCSHHYVEGTNCFCPMVYAPKDMGGNLPAQPTPATPPSVAPQKKNEETLDEHLSSDCVNEVLRTEKNLPAQGGEGAASHAWISVKDRLPPSGERILAYCQHEIGNTVQPWMTTANKFTDDEHWYGEDAFDVLYWMPLPPPPVQTDKPLTPSETAEKTPSNVCPHCGSAYGHMSWCPKASEASWNNFKAPHSYEKEVSPTPSAEKPASRADLQACLEAVEKILNFVEPNIVHEMRRSPDLILGHTNWPLLASECQRALRLIAELRSNDLYVAQASQKAEKTQEVSSAACAEKPASRVAREWTAHVRTSDGVIACGFPKGGMLVMENGEVVQVREVLPEAEPLQDLHQLERLRVQVARLEKDSDSKSETIKSLWKHVALLEKERDMLQEALTKNPVEDLIDALRASQVKNLEKERDEAREALIFRHGQFIDSREVCERLREEVRIMEDALAWIAKSSTGLERDNSVRAEMGLRRVAELRANEKQDAMRKAGDTSPESSGASQNKM